MESIDAASSVPFHRRPATAPSLDPRRLRPAVNAALVPKALSAFLAGAIWRVLGLWYPPVPAQIANSIHRIATRFRRYTGRTTSNPSSSCIEIIDLRLLRKNPFGPQG
jgi:hypothetical protein